MSGFVSGGTIDAPKERDEAWLKAEQEVEARRLAKLDAGKQDDGKTLYDTLQANKAAKQEAFEESMRLKNQFRSLDEDEVDFLESIVEAERTKEAVTRRETKQQVDEFRIAQEKAQQASKQADDAIEPAATETWSTSSRKRRKHNEPVRAFQKRRTSGNEPAVAREQAESAPETDKVQGALVATEQAVEDNHVAPAPSAKVAPFGLAGYSSSEDEAED